METSPRAQVLVGRGRKMEREEDRRGMGVGSKRQDKGTMENSVV